MNLQTSIPVNDAIVPVRMVLKAGVPQTTNVNGEFVFIDQGRDLTIRFNGSIISGRKAGDVMRGRGQYKEVTVISPYDQVIDLVLGFGDYNRLIVSGEMNVSAYVEMQGGAQADSLPMTIEREVGATIQTVEFAHSTVAYTSAVIGNANIGQCGFWFQDRFYVFGSSSQNIYTVKLGQADATFAGQYSLFGNSIVTALGAAATPDGTIYWRDSDHLSKIEMGVWTCSRVASNCYSGLQGTGRKGLHYYKGRLYSLRPDGWGIESVNLQGGDRRNEIDFSINIGVELIAHGDKLLVDGAATPPWRGFRITESGGVERYDVIDQQPGAVLSAQALAIDPDFLYVVVRRSNDRFELMEWRTVTTYGDLYTQPVGDPTRRETVKLFDQPVNYEGRAGSAIVYDWVNAVLASVGGGSEPDNYLVGYRYDDGRVVREVSSGTQTFARRGMSVPELPVLDGSKMSVTILPEYFD